MKQLEKKRIDPLRLRAYAVRKLRKLIVNFISSIFSLVRLDENLILFEGNKSYDDNARALYEEMIRRGMNERYRMIWFVEDPERWLFLGEIHNTEVKRVVDAGFSILKVKDSLIYLLYNCRAKYCIYCNCFLGYRKTKGQINAYLTHGVALKNLVGMFGDQSEHDLVFATSAFSATLIEKAIPGIEKKVRITGAPRNDVLLRGAASIIEQSDLTAGFKKRIIWMPTFKRNITQLGGLQRNDFSESRKSDVSLMTQDYLLELNELLASQNAVMYIKFHPFQNLDFVNSVKLTNIVSLTKSDLENQNVSLYSFLSTFDALITDYSSVYFDYLLLDRPIAFDLTDYEYYSQGIGFSVDDPCNYMPGELVFAPDDLIRFINDVCNGKDIYVEERRRIRELFNEFQDDKSASRVIDCIFGN